jgi:hypothetical protein
MAAEMVVDRLIRHIAPYAIPQEQEIALLEGQSKMLEQALEEVERRLEELKKVNKSQ